MNDIFIQGKKQLKKKKLKILECWLNADYALVD